MTPLQKVAMGLVIVFLRAPFGGFDGLPDPLGWVLVVAGLLSIHRQIPHGDTALALAVLAGLVSVPLVVPSVDQRLTPAGAWGLGVPQTAFCLVLVLALTTLTERAGDPEERWFRWLRTGLLVALVGPVLVYGGGVTALTLPVTVLVLVVDVSLVYLTFRVSGRAYASRRPGTAEPPERAAVIDRGTP